MLHWDDQCGMVPFYRSVFSWLSVNLRMTALGVLVEEVCLNKGSINISLILNFGGPQIIISFVYLYLNEWMLSWLYSHNQRFFLWT